MKGGKGLWRLELTADEFRCTNKMDQYRAWGRLAALGVTSMPTCREMSPPTGHSNHQTMQISISPLCCKCILHEPAAYGTWEFTV